MSLCGWISTIETDDIKQNTSKTAERNSNKPPKLSVRMLNPQNHYQNDQYNRDNSGYNRDNSRNYYSPSSPFKLQSNYNSRMSSNNLLQTSSNRRQQKQDQFTKYNQNRSVQDRTKRYKINLSSNDQAESPKRIFGGKIFQKDSKKIINYKNGLLEQGNQINNALTIREVDRYPKQNNNQGTVRFKNVTWNDNKDNYAQYNGNNYTNNTQNYGNHNLSYNRQKQEAYQQLRRKNIQLKQQIKTYYQPMKQQYSKLLEEQEQRELILGELQNKVKLLVSQLNYGNIHTSQTNKYQVNSSVW